MISIQETTHGWNPTFAIKIKLSQRVRRKGSLRNCLNQAYSGVNPSQSMDFRKTHCGCGKGTIMSTESAQENGADPGKEVPMATKESARIRQLEKEKRSLQEGITIYRTYFRVCAESETDPQKKRLYERLANAEKLESLSEDVLKNWD